MSQVLPITNETEITAAPEQNRSRESDIDFDQLLKKEEQKVSIPNPFAIIQSFISSILSFGGKTDSRVNKVEEKPMTNNDSRSHMPVAQAPNESRIAKNETNKSIAASDKPVNQIKADNIRFANDAVKKLFIGELQLTPELYDVMLKVKNKTDSLKAIDINDLVSQIQDKIKLLKENGKIELSMQLKPENLGTILMNITSNKGVISISLYANGLTREALEESIHDLENALKRVNLNIGSLNVFSDDRRKNNRREIAELLYNN